MIAFWLLSSHFSYYDHNMIIITLSLQYDHILVTVITFWLHYDHILITLLSYFDTMITFNDRNFVGITNENKGSESSGEYNHGNIIILLLVAI